MSINTTKASARKAGKATSKATKATTTTTSKAAAVTMDPAAVTAAAVLVLGKYKTISGIKATASALRDKYGPANWSAILARCKDLRADNIKDLASKARAAVFAYRPILAAAFKVLAGDPSFKALCRIALVTYKGTDADAAAALVRDFAPAVDAATGAPLVLVRYLSKGGTIIMTAYQPRVLSDVAAVAVLKSALSGLESATRKAARKGADATAASADNKRVPGLVVACYRAETDADGMTAAGAVLASDKVTPDKDAKGAAKVAAGLVGKDVPADARPLADVNSAARAAQRAKERAAYDRERAGLAKDATAAGLATKAPGAGHVGPRPSKATKGAPLAGDAFITATKAATKADAVTLNA